MDSWGLENSRKYVSYLSKYVRSFLPSFSMCLSVRCQDTKTTMTNTVLYLKGDSVVKKKRWEKMYNAEYLSSIKVRAK